MDHSLRSENETYARLLEEHLGALILRLRLIPADRWEWQIEISAPSAKMLAEHALMCLRVDRQHIELPDVLSHPDVPAPPDNQFLLCDELTKEGAVWVAMIRSMTVETLAEPRRQFNSAQVNVRWFLFHSIQNTIYKHGQLSTIFFALGLDGPEPYTAPSANPAYRLMREAAGLKGRDESS